MLCATYLPLDICDADFLASLFGVHRMYQGKWITGIIYLCTGGLFLVGILYDFWTMNDQISMKNARRG